MEYEFYMDLFFLTDFFLNLLSLFLTAGFLRQTIRPARIFLAAAIGSFWNCFLILVPVFPEGILLFITLCVVGNLMLLCAFPGIMKEWRQLASHGSSGRAFRLRAMKRLLAMNGVLLMASALVSGSLSFSRQHFYLSDGERLLLSGLICLLIDRLLKSVFKRGKIGTVRYRVRLHYCGKVKEFLALADSGNRLQVPDTGKPVSLISYRDCDGFCDKVSGGFYIPYRAVGTEKGLLFAMIFEKMEVFSESGIMTVENPAVAIVKESLSANGDFSMILPEEYVPGE